MSQEIYGRYEEQNKEICDVLITRFPDTTNNLKHLLKLVGVHEEDIKFCKRCHERGHTGFVEGRALLCLCLIKMINNRDNVDIHAKGEKKNEEKT